MLHLLLQFRSFIGNLELDGSFFRNTLSSRRPSALRSSSGHLILGRDTTAFFVHNQHLQAVFDIGKADVRVVIQRQNLHIGIKLLQPFDNASAHDMVGQTAEGLSSPKA